MGKQKRTGKGTRLKEVEMEAYPGKKKAYLAHVAELQLKMLRVQQVYHHQRRRAVLVFEGWDAGGKGGCIRRLREKLDPRGYRVHAIGAPTEDELRQHYLQRFWAKLPRTGKIAMFDRSWYGRVLVERVEELTPKADWKRGYDEINRFEQMLHDDGTRVLKFFLHITPQEQLRRFEERLRNPYKRWKLTSDDLRNRARWGDYEQAIDDMLEKTSTDAAPWVVVGADHKWSARVAVLEEAIAHLGEGLDLSTPTIDPRLVRTAEVQLGITLGDGKRKGAKDKKGKKGAKDKKGKKGKRDKGRKNTKPETKGRRKRAGATATGRAMSNGTSG